jgi:lipopolysaccharide export system ATP-binding protein
MSSLEVKNIAKKFGARTVVKDVSVTIQQGEIVGLLGPNGAGKTTCFYMILGLIEPSRGHIKINGLDITHHAIHQRAQLGLSYLPQEKSIFRKMTVSENILAVLETKTSLNSKQRHQRLEQLLNDFNLSALRNVISTSLSGGECRRTELARALASNPKILLLDEPFAGVDPLSIRDIKKMILDLKQRNIGVLITDHNVKETLQICDRAIVINNGIVLAEGNPHSILDNQTVKDVYLGNEFKI